MSGKPFRLFKEALAVVATAVTLASCASASPGVVTSYRLAAPIDELRLPGFTISAKAWGKTDFGCPPPWIEPKTLELEARRLNAERHQLAATGIVELQYTVPQLQTLVSEGVVPHGRYLARLASGPLGPDSLLTAQREIPFQPLWFAPMEQTQPADTSPEALTRLFGLNVNPASNYTLLLFKDFGTKNPLPPQTYIPTWEVMRNLSARYLTTPQLTVDEFDAVLTPEYAETYEAYMQAFYAAGFREWVPADVEAFIAQTPSLANDPVAADLFRARIRVHAQFGASELFLGVGLTQLLGDPDRDIGVQEIFMLVPYDPTQTVGYYEQLGQLEQVPCPPLVTRRPLDFTDPDCPASQAD